MKQPFGKLTEKHKLIRMKMNDHLAFSRQTNVESMIVVTSVGIWQSDVF